MRGGIVVIWVCLGFYGGAQDAGCNLFPSPATENFTINIRIESEHYLVEVFDVKGKLVYTNPFIRKGETKINCRDWIPGVYLVAVQAGDIRKTYKLVKE
jgi:hypothetical protein